MSLTSPDEGFHLAYMETSPVSPMEEKILDSNFFFCYPPYYTYWFPCIIICLCSGQIVFRVTIATPLRENDSIVQSVHDSNFPTLLFHSGVSRGSGRAEFMI